jgi:hypothetical protein
MRSNAYSTCDTPRLRPAIAVSRFDVVLVDSLADDEGVQHALATAGPP